MCIMIGKLQQQTHDQNQKIFITMPTEILFRSTNTMQEVHILRITCTTDLVISPKLQMQIQTLETSPTMDWVEDSMLKISTLQVIQHLEVRHTPMMIAEISLKKL